MTSERPPKKFIIGAIAGATFSPLCLAALAHIYGAMDFQFRLAKGFSDSQIADPAVLKVLHSSALQWQDLTVQVFMIQHGFTCLTVGAVLGVFLVWLWDGICDVEPSVNQLEPLSKSKIRQYDG